MNAQLSNLKTDDQNSDLTGAALAWTARVGVDLVLLLVVAQRRVFVRGIGAPMRHNLATPEPERS